MIRINFFLAIGILLLIQSCYDSIELENGGVLKIAKNSNGIITDSLTYNRNGELHGFIKSTDKEGFVIYIDYKNGAKDGIYKDFYKNKNLHINGHFNDGKKWREWIEYRENGVVSRYEAYTPEEDLVYLRIYDEKGKLKSKSGEAFMFYSFKPEDSIIYVDNTLLANIFIAYPPNCILKARTILYNPQDSIVNVMEYTFNKAFVLIKEHFESVGTYRMKTYWIMKDTIENEIEKGISSTEYEVLKRK